MPTSPEEFLETYLAAVNAADAAALKSLYAPDARVFDAMGAWELTGSAWSDRIDEWIGECKPGGANRVKDLTVLSGGELAVLNATITYDSELTSGDRGSCTLRFSLALRRVGDGDDWQIVSEHSSFPVTMDAEPKIITDDR